MDFLEGIDDIGAHATNIGDVGVLTDIDTVVDTATEVFGKVAVDVTVDGALFDVCIEDEGIGHEIAFCVLNGPAFPEIIRDFVAERFLIFVWDARKEAVANRACIHVVCGFMHNVAVPEDDVARFSMELHGLDVFGHLKVFGMSSKCVFKVVRMFLKEVP